MINSARQIRRAAVVTREALADTLIRSARVGDNLANAYFMHRVSVASYLSAVERAGLHGLAEGQKVAFEAKADPRRGKTSAENLKAL